MTPRTVERVSPTHQAALADPARTETVITHAFTGRPARGLRNSFIDTYEPLAPFGYPAIHHLTSPLRKAAAAAGDPDLFICGPERVTATPRRNPPHESLLASLRASRPWVVQLCVAAPSCRTLW